MGDLKKYILNGNIESSIDTIVKSIRNGVRLDTLINEITVILSEAGEQFSNGSLYLPELLAASVAAEKCIYTLKSYMPQDPATRASKVVIATVEGDLHSIEKDLISIMLAKAGYQTFDMGVNVSVNSIIKALNEDSDRRLIIIPVAMTRSILIVKNYIDVIHNSIKKKDYNIIVGGNAISSQISNDIGADASYDNVNDVVDLANTIEANPLRKE